MLQFHVLQLILGFLLTDLNLLEILTSNILLFAHWSSGGAAEDNTTS